MFLYSVVDSVRSKSTQTPTSYWSDLGIHLQAENFTWTFSDFWNPRWKGMRKAGNLNLLATTTTRASRSEQWAASKPSINRHHSRTSRSEQWAAIGREEGSVLHQFTSKLFFIRKTSFSVTLSCTRDYLLRKVSFSSSEEQPFSGCTIWRSDPLSTFFLTSRCSVKVKNLSSSSCTSLVHQPSGDGRPPDLDLSSLLM